MRNSVRNSKASCKSLKDSWVVLGRGQSRKTVQGVGGFDAPVEREQTGCVRGDRARAVELEVELIFVFPAALENEIAEKSQRWLVSGGNIGQHRLEEARILQPLTHPSGERLEEREVAGHGTHVEKQECVFRIVKCGSS